MLVIEYLQRCRNGRALAIVTSYEVVNEMTRCHVALVMLSKEMVERLHADGEVYASVEKAWWQDREQPILHDVPGHKPEMWTAHGIDIVIHAPNVPTLDAPKLVSKLLAHPAWNAARQAWELRQTMPNTLPAGRRERL